MIKKIWDKCGDCNGRGKIHVSLQPKRRCPACEGMGYIQKSVLAGISVEKSAASKSFPEPRQKLKPRIDSRKRD
jgi:DnaJ-class molecular chaperone